MRRKCLTIAICFTLAGCLFGTGQRPDETNNGGTDTGDGDAATTADGGPADAGADMPTADATPRPDDGTVDASVIDMPTAVVLDEFDYRMIPRRTVLHIVNPDAALEDDFNELHAHLRVGLNHSILETAPTASIPTLPDDFGLVLIDRHSVPVAPENIDSLVDEYSPLGEPVFVAGFDVVDDFGLVEGRYGESSPPNMVLRTGPIPHPVLAGLPTGEDVQVYRDTLPLNPLGSPPGEVEVLAVDPGAGTTPAPPVTVIAATGAGLANGTTAPARRVGWGVESHSRLAWPGWKLHDNAIRWLEGEEPRSQASCYILTDGPPDGGTMALAARVEQNRCEVTFTAVDSLPDGEIIIVPPHFTNLGVGAQLAEHQGPVVALFGDGNLLVGMGLAETVEQTVSSKWIPNAQVPQEYRAGLSEVLDLGEEMTVGTIPEGAEAVGAVPIATLESGDVTVLAAPEGDSSTEGYDFLGFRMAIGLHGPNLGRDGLNPEVLRLFDAAVQAAMANQ